MNAAKGINPLADQVLVVENANPDSVVIVVDDFNHTCLSKALPRYKQHVDCPTRKDKTLDQYYTVCKGAYLDPRLQTKVQNCQADGKDREKAESREYRGTARMLRVYGLERLRARLYRSRRIHRRCDSLRKLLCEIVHPHTDSLFLR